jgi:hypothetical protein
VGERDGHRPSAIEIAILIAEASDERLELPELGGVVSENGGWTCVEADYAPCIYVRDATVRCLDHPKREPLGQVLSTAVRYKCIA